MSNAENPRTTSPGHPELADVEMADIDNPSPRFSRDKLESLQLQASNNKKGKALEFLLNDMRTAPGLWLYQNRYGRISVRTHDRIDDLRATAADPALLSLPTSQLNNMIRHVAERCMKVESGNQAKDQTKIQRLILENWEAIGPSHFDRLGIRHAVPQRSDEETEADLEDRPAPHHLPEPTVYSHGPFDGLQESEPTSSKTSHQAEIDINAADVLHDNTNDRQAPASFEQSFEPNTASRPTYFEPDDHIPADPGDIASEFCDLYIKIQSASYQAVQQLHQDAVSHLSYRRDPSPGLEDLYSMLRGGSNQTHVMSACVLLDGLTSAHMHKEIFQKPVSWTYQDGNSFNGAHGGSRDSWDTVLRNHGMSYLFSHEAHWLTLDLGLSYSRIARLAYLNDLEASDRSWIQEEAMDSLVRVLSEHLVTQITQMSNTERGTSMSLAIAKLSSAIEILEHKVGLVYAQAIKIRCKMSAADTAVSFRTFWVENGGTIFPGLQLETNDGIEVLAKPELRTS